MELRDEPMDTRRRTFLFELLCFAGEFDRAEKQLAILADTGRDAAMGSLVYRAAVQAERMRREMFEKGTLPPTEADLPAGAVVNGRPAQAVEDADPRIGARLEVFAAGSYMWLPMAHIASIRMEPPKRLRDLLWIPAVLRTSARCKGLDLGEVLIPALTPLAFRSPDDLVRLGRQTVWEEIGEAIVPTGQKLLLVDGEQIPILEVRTLEFSEGG
jgi:type VI secretion system protein ImpE